MIFLSPLQLEQVWIEDIEFHATPATPTIVTPETNQLVAVLNHERKDDPENPRSFRSRLRMSFHPQEANSEERQYIVKMTIVGEFTLTAEVKPETRENYFDLSAPSILYGFARCLVLSITGMAPHGKFILPSVDPKTFKPQPPPDSIPPEAEKPRKKKAKKH